MITKGRLNTATITEKDRLADELDENYKKLDDAIAIFNASQRTAWLALVPVLETYNETIKDVEAYHFLDDSTIY